MPAPRRGAGLPFPTGSGPTVTTDDYEIYVMNVGTGSEEHLTRYLGCDEFSPAWSRSGRWIAFACYTGGIFIMRDDRSRRQRVVRTAGGFEDGEPAWSPDGHKLAFRGSKGIWVVNADGTGLRRLTRRAYGSPTGPPTAGRSRFIACWALIRDGRKFSRFLQPVVVGSCGLQGTPAAPAWSPDGRSIAFVRNGSLWIMRSDGRSKYRVPGVRKGLEITDLAWSPDGRYVAYYVYCCREGGIYITTLDGNDRKVLGGRRRVPGHLVGPVRIDGYRFGRVLVDGEEPTKDVIVLPRPRRRRVVAPGRAFARARMTSRTSSTNCRSC